MLLKFIGMIWFSNITVHTAENDNIFSKCFKCLTHPMTNNDDLRYSDSLWGNSNKTDPTKDTISKKITSVEVRYLYCYTKEAGGNFVGFYKILDNGHYFQPLYSKNRIEKSDNDDLQSMRTSNHSIECKKLTIPIYEMHEEITKDGNDFFKALSLIRDGTQNNHSIYRELIYKEVINNNSLVEILKGEDNLKKYLQKRKIKKNGVLSGVIEIFAAVYLIKMCIYIYIDASNMWFFFHEDWPNYNSIDFSQLNCLYFAIKKSQIYIVNDVYDINQENL
ncbi:uncharacterized protein LOC126904265 [Daktulosphaira vitifoliae]|uniref:uncharacterized protein LOC126904265 n=1 Tax=Daktulosphaira vitifoliae TaxID=58002 RepID=UPI0021AA856A|nr:uncharacterized protein LOC126904265 [Daktulosphaira vitifoliae]